MQHIALLGASGSIGRQTLDVCRRHADKVKLVAIAVNSSLEFAISCAREFDLSYVVISDASLASSVPLDAFPAETEVIFGSEHLAELCELPEVDCVVNALVGAVGISAGYAALRCGKRLAYAIDYKTEGYYVLVNFQAEADLPKELERNLQISDSVIRYQVIKQIERKVGIKPRAVRPAPAAPVAEEAPAAEEPVETPAAE